ncbi:ATP-binding protein [Endozoicomonas arenosclerae]|uniref:ATP-binding protein n=1 Tax=Endozoicomonas arenosclerae TaxID=1633495 RepID=UPI0007808572|nr:ATP-binding protein [Endozoicomonas arenosclerae]
MSLGIKRLWPSSLAGQMVSLVLVALILSVVISTWILSSAYNRAVDNINQDALLRRVVTLVELLESSPESLHKSILKASDTRNEKVLLSSRSMVHRESLHGFKKGAANYLLKALGPEYEGRIRIDLERNEDDWFDYDRKERWERSEKSDLSRRDQRSRKEQIDRWKKSEKYREWRKHKGSQLVFLEVSIKLNNGQWLNLLTRSPPIPRVLFKQTMLFMSISIFSVLLVVIFMVRRITRPMKKLASASHRLGLGENVEPLKEEGPGDIRETIQAFNLMNERMQRFVSDRTRMLAALSHDLRTPITTMRLRVEMMEESEDRRQMLATLDEMQQMSEATLAFMRQASDKEQTRKVDLNALLDSLCEDMVDMGHDVRFQEGPEVILSCRLISLKRALRNLIENGIKYGESVAVSLDEEEGFARIQIQDHGPGIPEETMEKVFEPFVRLEESRNRDTGGMGLGLSIARNIIHSHGGEIRLENNEHGLLVSVICPLK